MQRLLLVVAPASKTAAILKAVTASEAQHMVTGTENHLEEAEDRRAVWITVEPEKRQSLMDRLQAVLGSKNDWRAFVLPVEATLPLRATESEDKAPSGITTSREELYTSVIKGATLDRNYMLLVMLSTIVAAIGLMKDNVAAIIGAMVIAPLLGPNLAMILGTSLGDRDLVIKSFKTLSAGLALAVILAVGLGLFLPFNLESSELLARTDLGADTLVLALASGAAAALSLISGLSSTLVGVMVAVALLPPLSAFGLFLGAGQIPLSLGALTLFAANVVCVNFAGQVVFASRGIKPRSGWERKNAKQSVHVMLGVWTALLLVVAAIIAFNNGFFSPLS